MRNYQDAYLFSVQTARYYERLGDINQVIKYLEKTKEIFIEHKQLEDANRMTDLIIRFARSNNEYKQAINAVKKHAKSAIERGDTHTAATFAISMAGLLEEDKKADKALEFLQMIFNTTFESDKESALSVFEKILDIRSKQDEFNKISKKYLTPLLEKQPDLAILNVVKKNSFLQVRQNESGTEDEMPIVVLMRRLWPNPNQQNKPGGVISVVAENILLFDIRYYDGTEWQEAWPEELTNFPSLIMVTLATKPKQSEALLKHNFMLNFVRWPGQEESSVNIGLEGEEQ